MTARKREQKQHREREGERGDAVIKDFRIKTENIFSIIGTTGAFICFFVKRLS